MIVADVNLVVYYLLPGPFTESAEAARARDPNWIAPAIWSSEFLNVLATHIRKNEIDRGTALRAWSAARRLVLDPPEVELKPDEILDLSVSWRIATYDCVYVLTARKLGLRVVTNDKQMISAFPDVAVSISDFAAGK